MRQADGTLLYLHGDHLGSTSLVTKADGTIHSDQGYRAYGRYRRGGALPTDHRFTGQKLDPTGLYYYNARYYDPEIGQFISPDPLVPDPSHLFAYNRYMYVAGNPMRLTDSSGHFWETVADVVSVGYDVYDIYQNGLTWSSGGALVVDVAGAAIPFVPSAGTCVRWCDDAWQYGSKAVGWVGDKADEGWQAAKNLVGMGDEAAETAADIGKAADNIPCPVNSFSAETLVMTPSGAKPIAELVKGDLMLAYEGGVAKRIGIKQNRCCASNIAQHLFTQLISSLWRCWLGQSGSKFFPCRRIKRRVNQLVQLGQGTAMQLVAHGGGYIAYPAVETLYNMTGKRSDTPHFTTHAPTLSAAKAPLVQPAIGQWLKIRTWWASSDIWAVLAIAQCRSV
jgi:RHS repeat-associated protein